MAGITGLTINGLDVRTYAIEVETTDGWDAFPGVRSSGFEHPYRPGEKLSGRKFYRARDLTLTLLVFPQNASGLVTTTRAQHLQENLDALMGALHHSTATIPVVRTMPDATTRTAQVRVLQSFDVGEAAPLARRILVRLRMGHPFWRGASGQVTATGTLTNDGNAPITDAVITFTGAGSVVHANGDTLTTTGSCVVDIGEGTVKQGGNDADNLLTYDQPYLMIFEPGGNGVTITGTVTIDYFDAWF